MDVDAPLGEFGKQWQLRERQAVYNLTGFAVDAHCVGGETPRHPAFAGLPCVVSVFWDKESELTCQTFSACGVQDGRCLIGNLRGGQAAGSRSTRVIMFRMRISFSSLRLGNQRGLNRFRLAAKPRNRAIDVATGKHRPGDTRRGQAKHAHQQPGAGHTVQVENLTAAAALVLQTSQRTLAGHAPPQEQAAQGHNPQPARGDLGVELTHLAQVQIFVCSRNPVAQRQLTQTGVARLIAHHRAGVRVDEDAAEFAVVGQGFVDKQHARRLISLRGRPNLRHIHVGVRILRCLDLAGQRHLRGIAAFRRGHGQHIFVHEVFQGGRDGIQRATECRDENERGDKQPGIKVNSSGQRGQAAALACCPRHMCTFRLRLGRNKSRIL